MRYYADDPTKPEGGDLIEHLSRVHNSFRVFLTIGFRLNDMSAVNEMLKSIIRREGKDDIRDLNIMKTALVLTKVLKDNELYSEVALTRANLVKEYDKLKEIITNSEEQKKGNSEN